jgi:DNA-binding CsgD family transcriptional regulator
MATFWRRRGRPPYPDILTPSEQRVLELVRDGKTNGEIASELSISVPGVKWHVSNMLGKLRLTDRHQLAAWQPSDVAESGKRSGWNRVLVVKVAAATGALAAGVVAVAVGVAAYNGGDESAERDIAVPVSTLPPQSVLNSGLLLQVVDVVTDETKTVLTVRVSGLNSHGAGVMPASQIVLIDDTGHVAPNTRGSSDPNDRRLLTWEFPALSTSATRFTLNVGALWLVDPGSGTQYTVDGKWAIPIAVPGGSVVPSRPGTVSPAMAVSGEIEVTVDSVAVAADSVLVTGHFGNVGFDEVPEMSLAASLTQGAVSLAPTAMRLGFGEHRERFEVRFAAIHGEGQLSIRVSTAQVAHDATPAAALATKVAGDTAAEFTMELP